MAWRGVSEAQQYAAAVQEARRMVSRGERPGYRLRMTVDGSWTVDGLPGVTATATDRYSAFEVARAAIAAALEVEPSTFDLD